MTRKKTDFNKSEYDKQYHKEHYKNVSVVFPVETAERLEKASSSQGITKSAYIKKAVDEKLKKDEF